MKFLNIIFYFFFDFLIVTRNLFKNYNFIILTPRFLSILIKRVFIFDKNNKTIFYQNIRNYYDLLTVHEIFGSEDYNLKRLAHWAHINETYNLIVKKGKKPVIIDCGSNIGSSAKYFEKIFNQAFINMVEPDKINLEFSKKNISIKEKSFFNNLISCENKEFTFNNNYKDNRSFRVDNLGKNKVKGITVNDILKMQNNNYVPLLIKVDIEGFEKNLFEKNLQWMDLFDVIIIEIHDWMIPSQSNSSNLVLALSESIKRGIKRDLIISGENLISIKN